MAKSKRIELFIYKTCETFSRVFVFLHFVHFFKKQITMGRGDIRTKRGKISSGTYGVSRPAKAKKATAPKAEDKAAGKKAKA
ncbi:30S ribosomal protein THX [Taibaiella helva]|uniref:30S ribosomal protein THX n=1 Tax=Taibaiella helva TaxID=2301235 RepID=UPI001E4579A4|nr:30S ribosomal protein THX [Taibaiella helva]